MNRPGGPFRLPAGAVAVLSDAPIAPDAGLGRAVTPPRLPTVRWTDPPETEARIRWAREAWVALPPAGKPSASINAPAGGSEQGWP